MGVKNKVFVCSKVEGETKEEMVRSMDKAKAEGADLLHLSFNSYRFTTAHVISELEFLFRHRPLPVIVSLSYLGHKSGEAEGMYDANIDVVKVALQLEVEFVEVDPEDEMSCSLIQQQKRRKTRTIACRHMKGEEVHSSDKLGTLIAALQSTGADIIKLVVTDVGCITDVVPLFRMLTQCHVPLIAAAVGDRGLICQLLGPKFGGFIVYGSSSSEEPVPGWPTLVSIREVYKPHQYLNPDTKVFGLVSNPVGHSKGPLLHNPALRHTGYNGIYVPMLVDDVHHFFRVYSSSDFAGFSVGIPHKEAAVTCCHELDPLAKSIGAVNTIVRRPTDGKLIGYNTDCEASITAIEDALRGNMKAGDTSEGASPLLGKVFVLIGAGGAARALAFGAKTRGASRIVIFNRSYERAKALASAVCGEALPYDHINSFRSDKQMILANSSSVGMVPNVDTTPISKAALGSYELVFDAVYTPRNTRLLQEAREVGAITVSGIEMFIRQALGQFRLFTGGLAPENYIRKLVMEQF